MLRITILVLVGSLVAVAQCHDWVSFKETHEKSYPNAMEETRRREIFERRLKKIEEHNANEEHSYKMGINHMSDWTEEEMQVLRGFKAPAKGVASSVSSNSLEINQKLIDLMGKIKSDSIPDEVDWRKTEGVVSAVKNQLRCGSCWAFATTGVLEGQERILNISFVSLSEQNLVDCSTTNSGCSGGIMSEALRFVREEGGIESAKAYPYEAAERKCRFKEDAVAMKTMGSAVVGPNDEELLKAFVANYGPVSVAIAATDKLEDYESGVFDDPDCGNDLNHAVLIVGYGTDSKSGKDFWLVKNSWGSKWGEKGYIRMSRNKESQCGIAEQPTIALV